MYEKLKTTLVSDVFEVEIWVEEICIVASVVFLNVLNTVESQPACDII